MGMFSALMESRCLAVLTSMACSFTFTTRLAQSGLDYFQPTGGRATLSWDGSVETQSVTVQLASLPSDDQRRRTARDFTAQLGDIVPAGASPVPTITSNQATYVVTADGADGAAQPQPAQTNAAVWLLPEEAVVRWEATSVDIDG